MSNPILFGEGTYGCAFRPAIPCATASNTNIHNKISKVLTTSAAENEYAEYAKIAKADPKKKFYLGKPQKCLMSKNDYNAYVKNSGCGILKPNTSEKDYKLLQYLDGGSDLDDFVKIYLNQFLSHRVIHGIRQNKKRQSDLFWLNAHVLFMGLKAFAKKDILHDDLKPQNIVFKFDLAKDTMEFNYIDFGLMQDLTSIVTRIQNGSKIRGFHWSRPLESGFCDPRNETTFSTNIENVMVTFYTKKISDIIIKRQTTNTLNIKPSSFHLFFEYIEDNLSPNTNVSITEQVKSCMEGIMHYKYDWDLLIQKSLETSDTYSLGFTLNYVANQMHKKGALTDDEYRRLHQFFEKLFDLNVFTRWNNIDAIINEYESVLLLNGVLMRLGKKFRNHSVVVDNNRSIVRLITSTSANQSMNQILSKPCEPGKERNPKTRRCIKICPPGKTRRNGRCVKISISDSQFSS
jgi:serine/threonine protein kinase